MQKVTDFLAGKKTYIGFAAAMIYTGLIYFGVVESNELIWGAIATWTGVALRLAVKQRVRGTVPPCPDYINGPSLDGLLLSMV